MKELIKPEWSLPSSLFLSLPWFTVEYCRISIETTFPCNNRRSPTFGA